MKERIEEKNCKECLHFEACCKWTDFPKQLGFPVCRKYRKQSEVIDEFVKMLKEKMNNLSRMEYHCDPYFLVSEAFIDEIAEEMKGGAE